MNKCERCPCVETHPDEHPGLCCDCADTEVLGERVNDTCCNGAGPFPGVVCEDDYPGTL